MEVDPFADRLIFFTGGDVGCRYLRKPTISPANHLAGAKGPCLSSLGSKSGVGQPQGYDWGADWMDDFHEAITECRRIHWIFGGETEELLNQARRFCWIFGHVGQKWEIFGWILGGALASFGADDFPHCSPFWWDDQAEQEKVVFLSNCNVFRRDAVAAANVDVRRLGFAKTSYFKTLQWSGSTSGYLLWNSL